MHKNKEEEIQPEHKRKSSVHRDREQEKKTKITRKKCNKIAVSNTYQ